MLIVLCSKRSLFASNPLYKKALTRFEFRTNLISVMFLLLLVSASIGSIFERRHLSLRSPLRSSRKKKHTAPGEDRITYEMLRQLSPAAASNIIADVNNMWKHGFVVEPMKIIKVVPIPKPGKDQHNVSGKRPISLVPTLTKVANTAVLEKLQNFIEEHDILPGTSFGFRKGMSTNTCLSYVVNWFRMRSTSG